MEGQSLERLQEMRREVLNKHDELRDSKARLAEKLSVAQSHLQQWEQVRTLENNVLSKAAEEELERQLAKELQQLRDLLGNSHARLTAKCGTGNVAHNNSASQGAALKPNGQFASAPLCDLLASTLASRGSPPPQPVQKPPTQESSTPPTTIEDASRFADDLACFSMLKGASPLADDVPSSSTETVWLDRSVLGENVATAESLLTDAPSHRARRHSPRGSSYFPPTDGQGSAWTAWDSTKLVNSLNGASPLADAVPSSSTETVWLDRSVLGENVATSESHLTDAPIGSVHLESQRARHHSPGGSRYFPPTDGQGSARTACDSTKLVDSPLASCMSPTLTASDITMSPQHLGSRLSCLEAAPRAEPFMATCSDTASSSRHCHDFKPPMTTPALASGLDVNTLIERTVRARERFLARFQELESALSAQAPSRSSSRTRKPRCKQRAASMESMSHPSIFSLVPSQINGQSGNDIFDGVSSSNCRMTSMPTLVQHASKRVRTPPPIALVSPVGMGSQSAAGSRHATFPICKSETAVGSNSMDVRAVSSERRVLNPIPVVSALMPVSRRSCAPPPRVSHAAPLQALLPSGSCRFGRRLSPVPSGSYTPGSVSAASSPLPPATPGTC